MISRFWARFKGAERTSQSLRPFVSTESAGSSLWLLVVRFGSSSFESSSSPVEADSAVEARGDMRRRRADLGES